MGMNKIKRGADKSEKRDEMMDDTHIYYAYVVS